MDPRLDRKFPSVHDMEKAAYRRIPRFVRDYVTHGIGRGDGVRRNRDDLRAVQLMPRYIVEGATADLSVDLMGRDYDAPFGVAPVGAGGIAWPRAAEALASAARENNIPFIGSTFAVASLETLRKEAGDVGWFQLYRSTRDDLTKDLLVRAKAAGYEVLVVTADIPIETRRDHDTKNGFTFPLDWSLQKLWDIACCPPWAMANAAYALRHGIPVFENLQPYLEAEKNFEDKLAVTSTFMNPTPPDVLKSLRDDWDGKLVVKGILDPVDAKACQDIGCDSIIVSNHGGRQLEAAPSAVAVLPSIREAVGPDYPLIADGGIRTGLDICRMLAVGADFVLLGRPFYYAVAAMGPAGADHIMQVLTAELSGTMSQLGCSGLDELPERLVRG